MLSFLLREEISPFGRKDKEGGERIEGGLKGQKAD